MPEEVTKDVCTIEYMSEKTNAEATLVEVTYPSFQKTNPPNKKNQRTNMNLIIIILTDHHQVSFSKECSKQMVTVCQPGYHSPGYGYSKGCHLN